MDGLIIREGIDLPYLDLLVSQYENDSDTLSSLSKFASQTIDYMITGIYDLQPMGVVYVHSIDGDYLLGGYRDKRFNSSVINLFTAYVYLARLVADRYDKIYLSCYSHERHGILLAKRLGFVKTRQEDDVILFCSQTNGGG